MACSLKVSTFLPRSLFFCNLGLWIRVSWAAMITAFQKACLIPCISDVDDARILKTEGQI